METPLLDLNAVFYRAAHICASTEDVRAYIRCVRVEKHPDEGAVLIATDGHRMIVIHDPTAWIQKSISILLDPMTLKSCRATGPVPQRLKILEDGCAQIGALRSAKSVIVKGDYVDWRKVVPVQRWTNIPVSVNGRYLADFVKINGILNPEGHHAIRMVSGTEPAGPCLILFPHYTAAFGILMPMLAEIGNGLPVWMRPVMERKRKKTTKKPVAKKSKRKARP